MNVNVGRSTNDDWEQFEGTLRLAWIGMLCIFTSFCHLLVGIGLYSVHTGAFKAFDLCSIL